jgi:hypothetical protein
MALWIALGVVLLFVGVLWYVIGREPGPDPVDVAIAYERAWERYDFSALYDLSGEERRDGMRRDAFVAAQRAAFADRLSTRRAADRVDAEHADQSGDTAHVVTVLQSEGGTVHNDLVLRRRSSRWVVTAYALHEPAP